MTKTEGMRFVKTVLCAYWPKWELSDELQAQWCRRLHGYDFDKARKAIQDYAFNTTKMGIPVPSALFDAMECALIPKDSSDCEPIHVYEIVKEGNSRGYRFSLARRRDLPQDPQEMENAAEHDRKRLQELDSNVNWIVFQRWQQYYQEAVA